MKFRLMEVSLDQMERVATTISSFIEGGDIFILVGEIGAGKTTFVSRVAEELNAQVVATSPTFAIVADYPLVAEVKGISKIIHADTYRLTSVNELYDLGLETIFDENAVTFIEWGEKIEDYIDQNHFSLSFHEESPDKRNLTFEIKGEVSISRFETIRASLAQAGWREND